MKSTFLLLISGLLFSPLIMNSQTWIGSVSSDWNNAANWTPANVPTSSSNVILKNAAAPYQPLLAGNVSIATLNMSAGILNLDGFTLTCSGEATLTGDSLNNGKIIASTFNSLANMHMGGKIVLEKTGATNEFWYGKNKFYGDSLVIIWKSGALHMQNTALSPDSIFGHMKVQLIDNYSVYFSMNSPLYVQNNLILDNIGNGVFYLNNSNNTVIGGNLVAQNFSSSTSNFPLSNVTVSGNNTNGPFYCHTASIENCNFTGNFTLIADSNVTVNLHNSSFQGADNVFQAGSFDAYGNRFGKAGTGTTFLRSAHNFNSALYLRTGNNKFIGNGQWETYALYPGQMYIQNNWYGPDSAMQDLSFILNGNSVLTTNSNGHNYVAGNLIIDGQGARKWIQFDGGGSNTFTIGGNFTVKNFAPNSLPSVGNTNVYLRNVYVNGSDTCGTFYCTTGEINNSSFNGNFRLIADSSQGYSINNSSFLGADNLFQAGYLTGGSNSFGQFGNGTTILRAALNQNYTVYMRTGNNKFFGNAQWEPNAVYPGRVIMQHNWNGPDTCLQNLHFILKGNSVLSTNENGYNYVAGNVTIDGQGARKQVLFNGGTGNSFTIGGNFTVKNFTPFPDGSCPPSAVTIILLRNMNVSGTDTCGTFYCSYGDINNSNFKGDIKIIADSLQTFGIYFSSLLGANNFFQSGTLEVHDNKFGKPGLGSTMLKAALASSWSANMRSGNNKFFGDVQWEAYAVYPDLLSIQNNWYGPDTCLQNLSFNLKGNSMLNTNENGYNYVAGNVTIDGQGARKHVQFTGGTGYGFTIGGNFTVKNFTPNSLPSVGNTNVFLRNVYVSGSDTCGTFYCTTGDINNSSFNGNFRLIADSAGGGYSVHNSSFLGADNLFQGQTLYVSGNQFGKSNTGTTILRAANNLAVGPVFRDGTNTFIGDARVEAFSVPGGSVYFQQTYFGHDSCLGNFTVELNGPSSANLGANNLYLGKGLNLINNGTGTIVHDNGASAIHFVGTDTANYSYSGSGSAPSFINFEMNRRGGLRLMSPLRYTGTLAFTRGVILSSAANPLQIPNGAVVTGAWDSSYVDGPVAKTGNTAFTFPLGKNNLYAPIGITAPASATDAFKAEYKDYPAWGDGYDTSQLDATLNHLSREEYWLLDRTNGTSQVKVTLSWKEERSGIVDLISDLRVARWNGSMWKDEGIGTTSGTLAEGTIQSFNNISSFSPFTLASTSISNPLPVTYITFTASLQNNLSVLVEWKTATEYNSDHFEVERSSEGRNWTSLASITPFVTGEYSYLDKKPHTGVNYYRIKQVDRDGKFSYSVVRIVNVKNEIKLFIWPNPVTDNLYVQCPFKTGTIEITDINGRIIWKTVINNSVTKIPVQGLNQGAYLLVIIHDGIKQTEKFIKE